MDGMIEAKKKCAIVYTDDGASGICGQSMSITMPRTHVYIFDSEDDAMEWLDSKSADIKGSRRNPRYTICAPGYTSSTLSFNGCE